jgi:hypothetical protein
MDGSFVYYFDSSSVHVVDVLGVVSCFGPNGGPFSLDPQMIVNVSSLNHTRYNATE